MSLNREEVAALSGLKLQSVCARITELMELGIVTQKLRSSPDAQGRWYATRLTISVKSVAVLVAR
jgi:hypothetical protein